MRAMVLGSSGQDGTYLTRHLLRRGYEVIGVDRAGTGEHAVALDLRDAQALTRLLAEHRPDRIFHLAAVHASAAANAYEARFGDMLAVNLASVHAVLEHLRTEDREARLLYTSSVKAFGAPLPAVVDESTPRHSRCLYSVTKNAARDTIAYYRERHGVAASVVYPTQHESPLRANEFFIPKLAAALAGATRIRFFTLDFYCDWGSAEAYADLFIDVIDKAPGEDFVIGTGRCLHARELVERLYRERGLDPAELVATEGAAGGQPHPYRVRVDKLAQRIGRVPERTIESVIAEIQRAAR